jgi:hypothetical protein
MEEVKMARRKRPAGPEVLGEVTAPSGAVLVLDTGYLNMWCHDSPPVMPEGVLDDEGTRAANGGKDFRIEGPDAEQAGRTFNRQRNPFYLFDIPAHGLQQIRRSFNECVRRHKLKARLVTLKERVPHRRRVDLALERGPAGEVFFFGAWGCALGGVPADRTLRVLGERMPAGQYESRWRSVWLECRPGVGVARSEPAGDVVVDRARLMFADPDALGEWKHEEPLDGKADFVFWGADAPAAARQTKAPRLADNDWGWVDLPAREAARRGMRVEELMRRRGWRMATDFRPHSHHYLAMEQVRASPTESGTVEVGGAKVCVFMTSWGDGIYSLVRDLGPGGELVRVRVDLGSDETVDRMRRVEERYFGAFAKVALVSSRLLEGSTPVGWLYRDEPVNDNDSGWRVLAPGEPADLLNDANRSSVVPLRDLLAAQRDDSLEAALRAPVGAAFRRADRQAPFVALEGWDPNRG